MCYWHAELGVDVKTTVLISCTPLSPNPALRSPAWNPKAGTLAKEHLSEGEYIMPLTTTAFMPITTKVGSTLLTGGTILGLIGIYVLPLSALLPPT
jgi:hypothetical protein